ncbi:glycoside hydrolase family 61 protein [Tricladium varicosporioides]|nr:glycoside hydrolase family 61 protein [Hymenoscyphus varicosporioides]
MKGFALLLVAAVAQAAPHYTFPSLIGSTDWQYVRQWTGYTSNGPVQDVSSAAIRCNVNGDKNFAKGTMTVAAGATTGFASNQGIFHLGPALVYMAKVPAGKTAANWDGSGSVWFKIMQEKPTVGSGGLNWPSYNANKVSFKIPAATPPGEYLIRIEHIAMHQAKAAGGAQFYISCAQVTVTGSGSGTPGPLVAFPGAYTKTDPGIMFDIYANPVPKNYEPPGPAVWSG